MKFIKKLSEIWDGFIKKANSGLDRLAHRLSLPKKALSVICVLLSILLVAVLVLTISIGTMLARINRIDGNEPTLSPEQLESILNETEEVEITGPIVDVEDVTVSTHATEIETNDQIVNILLVGQDRRPGQPRLHSDSIILCTINKEMKTLTMTSFLRDLWVDIPGYYHERLNVPYMLKGFDLLNDTLEHTFGVRGDYNFEVDFAGFQAVIDSIGGIDLNLSQAEASYLNRRGNWDFNDASAGTWSLVSGINHMTGEQAFAFSRIRDLDSDLGRSSRQRYVLTRLMEEAKQMNAAQLLSLVNACLPMFSTDMKDNEIIDLATDLIPLLSDLKVVSHRIPADGAFSVVNIDDNGIIKNVLLMDDDDLKENMKLLREAMGAK